MKYGSSGILPHVQVPVSRHVDGIILFCGKVQGMNELKVDQCR